MNQPPPQPSANLSPARSPVAVFLYNRPDHSQRLLRSLEACARLDECQVHIYCDAPRQPEAAAAVEATRRVAREWARRMGAELVERAENLGCARSIVQEVTRHCRQRGRVIVLEDDLVLHPQFINYMLSGLDRYQDQPRVFHLCGFQFPASQPAHPQTFFLPFTMPWGWATWERAWSHYRWEPDLKAMGLETGRGRRRFDLDGSFHFSTILEKALQGRGDIWDIYWYAQVYLANGLALFPRMSLVVNNGWDGSGLHCGAQPRYGLKMDLEPDWDEFPCPIELPDRIEVYSPAYRRLKAMLRQQWRQLRPSPLARLRAKAGALVRRGLGMAPDAPLLRRRGDDD